MPPATAMWIFDHYPRGRVVYRRVDETYLLYHDGCIEQQVKAFAAQHYAGCRVVFCRDEHYRCHRCNRSYWG